MSNDIYIVYETTNLVNGKLFYSRKSAGEFFGVDGMTVSNWCRKYKIPHCYMI